MGRGRRRSKIEELFGLGRESRRGPKPLRFWPDRKIPSWRRYLPVLTGAAAFGLMVGLVPGVWPSAEGGPPDQPIPWNEVQAVPKPERSAEDEEWARQAEAVEASAGSGSRSGGADAVRVRFGFCHVGGGRNCVVDGDTFYLQGDKVRIAGIDAPETHPPRCAYEAELGGRATERLRELLNSGAVTMTGIDRDRDRYGRLLRNVAVDGADVGQAMVSAGVARKYGSGRRGWC